MMSEAREGPTELNLFTEMQTMAAWDTMISAEDILRMATINGVTIFVHRAQAWREPHSALPGSVVHAGTLAFVVAAADGLVAISEWSFNGPGATNSKLRR